MNTKIFQAIMVVVFTLLSGLGDAQGFIHAAKVWENGKLVFRELGLSSIGYAAGIVLYWISLKFLGELGVNSAAMQSLGWFVVTIVGVAFMSGDFLKWQMIDRGIAIAAIVCLGLLLYRTGA